MQTDSAEYVRSSGSARVLVQIHNLTDSTFIFPSCEQISYRVDTLQENVWSAGAPLWNSPCPAIYRGWTAIEKDSLFRDYIILTSAGTFRVVTIYGSVPGTYPDTLASNEFTMMLEQ